MCHLRTFYPNSASEKPYLFLPYKLLQGFHFNVDRHQGQLLAALGTFSVILLKNFIGRLEVCAFI